MKPSIGGIDERIRQFTDACRGKGLKVTHQRMEVFRELAQSEDHPDAETVYRAVRSRIPTISLDTVYRTLAMLESHGIISRVEVLHERARYDANRKAHHHFVCTRCGLVRDFYCSILDDLEIPKDVRLWGVVDSRHIELRGVCTSCARRGGEHNRQG